MFQVVRQALAVRQRYGMGGLAHRWEVEKALAGQGMRIFESRKLPPEVNGAHVDGVAMVRAGLLPYERCAILLHELAHHELHHGNGLYLANQSASLVLTDRREREATIYAGVALIGDPQGPEYPTALHDAWKEGVPLEFLFAYTHSLALHLVSLARFVDLNRMDVDYEALQKEPLHGEHRQRIWNGQLGI